MYQKTMVHLHEFDNNIAVVTTTAVSTATAIVRF